MDITDIEDNTADKKGEIKYRTFINYPRISNGGKAEKRINGFIKRIMENYKKDTAKASLYTYNRLKYKICCPDPLSLLFESEHRGKDGLFSYSLFSVTFSDDGYAMPLSLDRSTAHSAKKFFKSYGVRMSVRNMKYSYYLTENNQAVIYAKTPSDRRAKRSVAEYRI